MKTASISQQSVQKAKIIPFPVTRKKPLPEQRIIQKVSHELTYLCHRKLKSLGYDIDLFPFFYEIVGVVQKHGYARLYEKGML